MFSCRNYRGERFDLLRELLVERNSASNSYRFKCFFDGATSVSVDYNSMHASANNGNRLYFNNPVTHVQLGREFFNAVNYVDEQYPPKFQPRKVLRQIRASL